MDRSLTVQGSPDPKTPGDGACAHGVLAVGEEGTALAVSECVTRDAKASRTCVEAALSAFRTPQEGTTADRVRAAFGAADAALRARHAADGKPARCALAVVFVIEGQAWYGAAGPVRIYLVRGDDILSRMLESDDPLGGEERPFRVADQPWPLQQSDRLLLWTSPVYEVIEDTLLPNLMANRPPDRCVESMLKLANYRGLGVDYALVVAAWQDPALATFADGFRAQIDWEEDATTGGQGDRDHTPAARAVLISDAPRTEDVVTEELRTSLVERMPPEAAPSRTPWRTGLVVLLLLGILGLAVGLLSVMN